MFMHLFFSLSYILHCKVLKGRDHIFCLDILFNIYIFIGTTSSINYTLIVYIYIYMYILYVYFHSVTFTLISGKDTGILKLLT